MIPYVKKIIKVFFILIFISTISCASYCQFVKIANRVIVAGYVFDDKTSEPLPYVNVYVKKTRIGTITDNDGYFLLSAHIKDTLTFSSLGYDNKYVVLNDTVSDNEKPLIVFMDTKIFELKSVDVIALRRYKQFEYELTNMQLPDDDYTYAQNNFPFRPKDIDYYSRAGASGFGMVFHPISALYNMFSKEGKESQKLYELQQQDFLNKSIDDKLNIPLVMKITGLNHIETNTFIQWCNLSPEFILKMSEYELISYISYRYQEYLLYNKKILR